MAKRQKTPLELAYAKEVKRIKQFLYRTGKRGYQFEEGILPPKPKKITEATRRRLKKITPEYMYKKAVYGGEATGGEIVSGIEGRKAERSLRSQKAAQTVKAKKEQQKSEVPYKPQKDVSFFNRTTIAGYRESIRQMPLQAQSTLNSWLDRLIAEHGEDKVAKMLNDGAANGVVLIPEIAYEEGLLYSYLSDMLNYLDATDDEREELSDAFMETEGIDLFDL